MNEYEKLDVALAYLNEGLNLNEDQKIVKKNESAIKSFLNKSAKKFYEEEKEKFIKDENYDWRREITGAPTVSKFDYNETDVVFAYFSYPGNPWHDLILFFEDDFIRWLRKQNNVILNKFYFSCEDYPGIIIEPK